MTAQCPDFDGSGLVWAYPTGDPYQPKPAPGYPVEHDGWWCL